MEVRLTLALPFYLRVQEALARDPARVLQEEAGSHRSSEGVELFLPRGSSAGSARARIFRSPPSLRRVSHHYWAAFERRRYERPTLDLALDEDGGCSAALLVEREVHPVREVFLPGRWMERWTPGLAPPERVGAVPVHGRFSRYVGALGGDAVHARLRKLEVALVGVARLGSGLAVALARAGVRRLTLIDADVLEEHSLDAVECSPIALGRAKVQAVAEHLAEIVPETLVRPLALPVEDPAAFEACAAADLVVSAPDDNRARLAAALAANAHLRAHLDLGTGVFGQGETWTAGADVRLMLPGAGCLLCAGGIDLARRREPNWRRQRAGSLRSLNQIAVGQAMALVERLVAGELGRSVWRRLTLARDGILAAEEMPWELDPRCPLCCAELTVQEFSRRADGRGGLGRYAVHEPHG
jgi:adenylyltransferase/sulfurtransferase